MATSSVHQTQSNSSMDTNTLRRLVDENSTKQFYIEYGGFLSNHIGHGIVALHRLGADVKRINRFIEWYTPRLESSEMHKDQWLYDLKELEKGSSTLDKLLGTRSSFYYILDKYEEMLRTDFKGNVNTFIGARFQLLFHGLAASAFHGLIHLGYGYAAGSPRMICEGLAYLHHSYMPLNESSTNERNFPLATLGSGHLDIIDVLEKVRKDTELHQFLIAALREDSTGETSAFQRGLQLLLARHGDTLIQYVHEIRFPDFIDLKKITDAPELHHLMKWLINATLTVYAGAARRNDFFLLHTVTAAYSLKQIIPALTDPTTTLPTVVILESLRVFLCAFIASYRVQGAPILIEMQDIKDHDDMRTLVKETLSTDRDEHIYKLVQICAEFNEETEDEALKKVYKSACLCALNNKFIF